MNKRTESVLSILDYPYVWDTVTDEENKHLEIIAFAPNYILCMDKVTGKAYYFYEINDDVSCCYHNLCEVGQMYQYWFKTAIRVHGYTIEDRETDTEVFEILVKP